jgi:hypothetical protein
MFLMLIAIISWLSTFAKPTVGAAASKSNPSEVGVNYLAEKFLVDTVPTDSAWMVAVVEEGAEMPPTWSNATNSCVGVIKSVIVYCPKVAQNIGDDISLSFGQQICKQAVIQIPFIFIMKHGVTERKKLLAPAIKWDSLTFQFTDYDKAFKILGDSLPRSALSGIYENMLPQFVMEGFAKGLVTFVLLSQGSEPPSMVKNIAMSFSEIVQFGFLSGPSEDLLRGVGNLKLPAIIAIPPPDEKSEGMRVITYDHKALGPVKFASLSMFVDAVHRSLIQDG